MRNDAWAVRVLRRQAKKYRVPLAYVKAVKEALADLQWSLAGKRLACDWLTIQRCNLG